MIVPGTAETARRTSEIADPPVSDIKTAEGIIEPP